MKMKETKKNILKVLLKDGKKKASKFDRTVLVLALQKIDSDSFELDEEAIYTDDKRCLVYSFSQKDSFTVPEGVEVIGEMAFRRKKNLKNVILPTGLKKINHDAFYDCDQLDNVYVPASVEEVNGYAFAECESLKAVTFGGTPKHLSRHAFEDSDNLSRVIVPAGTVEAFQKALHYDAVDDEYLIIEAQPQPAAAPKDSKEPEKEIKATEKVKKTTEKLTKPTEEESKGNEKESKSKVKENKGNGKDKR